MTKASETPGAEPSGKVDDKMTVTSMASTVEAATPEGSGMSSFAEFERAHNAPPEEKPDDKAAATTGEAPPEDNAEDPPADDKVDDKSSAKADDKPAPKGEKPAKKPASERIGEITRARREAERQRDEALAEVARLRTAPAATAQPAGPGKMTDEQALAAMKAGDLEPDPEKFQYGELDAGYIRALGRYEAKQTFAELAKQHAEDTAQAAADAEHQERLTNWQKQQDAGLEKYDDFEEKVLAGSFPVSNELGALIAGSEVGADIAYHLATNLAEAKELAKKSPLAQAAWFGRQEARFTAPKAASQKQAKVPGADAPPNSQPRGASGKFKVAPDTTDFAAFEAMATQDMKSRLG